MFQQSLERGTGGFATKRSIFPVVTERIEVRKPVLVTVEPRGKDPTCDSTGAFDLHPPISFAVLYDI